MCVWRPLDIYCSAPTEDRRRLGFYFILGHFVYEDPKFRRWKIVFIPFGPIISNGVQCHVRVFVKWKGCNGTTKIGAWWKSGLGIFVPGVKGPICSCCGQGAMYWMGWDYIYGKGIIIRTVASKCEIFRWFFVFKVLNADTSLNGPNCISTGICKACNASGLPF